jgi:hypothetical protein
MGMVDKQVTFTRNVSKLIEKANQLEIGLTFGEAFRTEEQQSWYVRDGKSKTMNSRHLIRLAVDFNFFINGKLTYDKAKLQALGDYWESLNPGVNSWGGNWQSFIDTPHFEAKP